MVLLTVGIIGHRPNRLPPGADKAIAAALSDVLGVLASCAGASRQELDIRVATSLAEGADRLGAWSCLARSAKLVVILPFPAAEFEKDFTSTASLEEFRSLLAAASWLVELPWDAHSTAVRADAYRQASVLLLDTIDVLVAVWDGLPARGQGGTAETIADACSRNIPVIVVDAKGVAPLRLIRSGCDRIPLKNTVG